MSKSAGHRAAPHHSKFIQKPIGQWQRGVQTTLESVRRLKLESTLDGHSGCVNCLEWTRNGRLLASGSDDRNVIVWDPYKGTKRAILDTGHEGNIFSVKFMPDFSDTALATGASDGSVKLIDVRTSAKLLDCKSCYQDRVKRLAVHPREPHVIWSASENGCVLQYDTREPHACCSTPKNILIDLKTAAFGCLAAKCIDINPVKDEMIAVGANDVHIRVFDRRFVRLHSWESCTAYFTPGHLMKKTNSRSFGTTYLAFNFDGSELLANIHAEQVYLFNTYEPQEPYRSFASTAKPLIFDAEPASEPHLRKSSLILRSHSRWEELKKYCTTPSELPEKYKSIFKTLETKTQTKDCLSLKEFSLINDMLSECKHCAELYWLRAAALVNRRWRGDLYQAKRDCCYALALNHNSNNSDNNNKQTINDFAQQCLATLSLASHHSGDKDSSRAINRMLDKCDSSDSSDSSSSLIDGFDDDDDDDNDGNHHYHDHNHHHYSSHNHPSVMGFYESIAFREISSILPGYHHTTNGNLSSRSISILPVLLNGRSDDIRQLRMTHAFNELVRQETERASAAFDHTKRYYGHCNMNTDIKEANFFGDFIVAGSDDGAFYIWDKSSTNLIKAVYGDAQILNCLQPHPNICMLATSGIESVVKIWSPSGKVCHDVDAIEQRCQENQNFIISDPLEAMIMRLYPPQRDN